MLYIFYWVYYYVFTIFFNWGGVLVVFYIEILLLLLLLWVSILDLEEELIDVGLCLLLLLFNAPLRLMNTFYFLVFLVYFFSRFSWIYFLLIGDEPTVDSVLRINGLLNLLILEVLIILLLGELLNNFLDYYYYEFLVLKTLYIFYVFIYYKKG